MAPRRCPALGVKLHWLYLAAIAQAITMAGIVIVSLLTLPPAEEQWRPFHWDAGRAQSNMTTASGVPGIKASECGGCFYTVVWVYHCIGGFGERRFQPDHFPVIFPVRAEEQILSPAKHPPLEKVHINGGK